MLRRVSVTLEVRGGVTSSYGEGLVSQFLCAPCFMLRSGEQLTCSVEGQRGVGKQRSLAGCMSCFEIWCGFVVRSVEKDTRAEGTGGVNAFGIEEPNGTVTGK